MSSTHYSIMERIKERIFSLGLLDRDGVYIPEERIKVFKTSVRDKARILLQDSENISFPCIVIFHEEDSERWDKSNSTNMLNLIYFPIHISLVDTDRGVEGIAGRPDEELDHDLRLSWRDDINQHFCSQTKDTYFCDTNKISTKMFEFADWDENGLWRSLLAFEFGVYLSREGEVSLDSPLVGYNELLQVGDTSGLSTESLSETENE